MQDLTGETRGGDEDAAFALPPKGHGKFLQRSKCFIVRRSPGVQPWATE